MASIEPSCQPASASSRNYPYGAVSATRAHAITMAGPYHIKILRASTLEAAKLQPRDDDGGNRVPPWISVFILFGALGALVFLFTLA